MARCHHLFAEVLQAHLNEAQRDLVATLHQRAGEWYMQNGLPVDAINHALASGDFEWTAGMIELAWSATEDGNMVAKYLGWAKALPDVRPISALALVPLRRALHLAEPEGYIRIFADEGEPMAELLARLDMKDRTIRMNDYILSTQALFEPLSERELEVLRLLRTELSGPEISRQLFVSLNTFHTHTRNIYNKLGSNNRRAAVRRAEELDLL